MCNLKKDSDIHKTENAKTERSNQIRNSLISQDLHGAQLTINRCARVKPQIRHGTRLNRNAKEQFPQENRFQGGVSTICQHFARKCKNKVHTERLSLRHV